ncbi:MAG: hypothetical protein V3T24_05260, partial [Longimicrobiales bacterium]
MALLLLDRAEECLDLEVSLRAYEAMCLHDVGRVAEAEAQIQSLAAGWTSASSYMDADGLATYYAWTRQPEELLRWIERGLEGSPFLNTSLIVRATW